MPLRTTCLIVAIALFPVVAPSRGRAEVIDFSGGFATAAGLAARGSAAFTGGLARLTDGGFFEAGRIFSTTPATVTQFDTTFTFQLHGGTAPDIADGITFTIASLSSTVGSAGAVAGGSLGYGVEQGTMIGGIPNSVAVKFDTFDNAGEGNNSTGLFTGGAFPGVPAIDLTPSGINLHSQHLFKVDLAYDGTTLTETILDLSLLTPVSFTTSFLVNIPAAVESSTAGVGFTGATGGGSSIQDIHAWRFESDGAAVPEPATLLLLGSGSLAVLAWRRHRR